MARELKRVKVGDELTCSMFNSIIDELNRLRRMKGVGLVDVDGMDGTSPPVIVGHAAKATSDLRIWLPTGIAGGTFGTPATATDAILCVRSGGGWTTSGGTTITVNNCDTVGIGGAKAAWAVLRDDNSYELKIADC